MPRKLQTAQPTFTLLVANLTGGSDPSKGVSGNPVKARTGLTYQHFPEIQRQGNDRSPTADDPLTPGIGTRVGLVDYTTSPVPVGASATIVVADNNFSDAAHLSIGEFTLTSGEHFIVGGTTAITATNLAAAINRLPGFSAPTPGASTITVTGPAGPGGNAILLEAVYGGAIQNFTLTPDDGSFGSAEPTIGPPDILP